MSDELATDAVEGEAEEGELPHGPSGPSRLPLLLTLGGILLLAGLVILIPPLRDAAGFAIKGDTEALRAELDGRRRHLGPASSSPSCTRSSGTRPKSSTPRPDSSGASGPALALVMVGWMLNAYVAFEIGRHAARPVLYRVIGRERFLALRSAAERGGVFLLIAVRLIPIVPFSLFTIVAGAAHVPLWRLMWTTAIGYLPITALFVYLGTQLEELSPTNPVLIGGGIALIAVIYAGHRLRGRLFGGASPAAPPDAE